MVNQTLAEKVTLYTPAELSVGTYYWRVRGRNASFTGAWSSVWKLILIATAP